MSRFLKRHFLSMGFVLLAGLAVLGWWNSSRYAERHILQAGGFAVDVFSSSSLLRVSFLNSKIHHFGLQTRYRQPNPRGKFIFRPQRPLFRAYPPDLFEVTLGFWHLTFSLLLLAGLTALGEIWRQRRRTKVFEKPSLASGPGAPARRGKTGKIG